MFYNVKFSQHSLELLLWRVFGFNCKGFIIPCIIILELYYLSSGVMEIVCYSFPSYFLFSLAA